MDQGFWHGKRVLITGHTGFKGSWLCEMLLARGAIIFGLALEPASKPSLFVDLCLKDRIDHKIVDLRDQSSVRDRLAEVQPDFIFHLGAQALVSSSYLDPIATWEINLNGTINILGSMLDLQMFPPTVIVTTDKVYRNEEWVHCYRETDRLGGGDPYSASKAVVEIAVDSWRTSFPRLCLATVRAGNVIGGGDWSNGRLLPDLVRSFLAGKPIELRNPNSTRPFQHVIEPLSGYLRLAERLAGGAKQWQTAFNFGPEPKDVRSVQSIVELVTTHWPGKWVNESDGNHNHEAGFLALEIERSRQQLGWYPRWDIEKSVLETINWYRDFTTGSDPVQITHEQLCAYEGGA